ncbi:hypothetical protein DP117_05305 [Brasilonema sp. UFV-L1]|nr:hypothetical protein [Brasilonema sp. UFV-L1]
MHHKKPILAYILDRFWSNTVQLSLKLFVKVNFLNVDAQRLPAGYRKERKGHKEKKEMLN